MVSNCYIDELIDNEIKRNIRGTTKTVNDRRSVIGHQHEAESTVNTDADFCWKTTATDNTSESREQVVGRNFSDDLHVKEQPIIVDIREGLNNSGSFVYEKLEDKLVKDSRLPEKDSASRCCEASKETISDRDKEHIEGDRTSFEEVKLKVIATEHAKISNDSVLLQELTHPSELSKTEDNSKMEEVHAEMYFHTTFIQFEKQLISVQDELSQLRNASERFQRQGKRRSRARYKRLKKRVVSNEENIKSLTQSSQRDVNKQNKESEQDFIREIRCNIDQLERLLKQCSGNKFNQPKKEDNLDNVVKELKEVLEKAIINVQKYESRTAIGYENKKSQKLKNKFHDLNKVLQETKLALESKEKRLNERDDTVKELKWQLYGERKSKEGQLMDKESEVYKLQGLLSDSNKNAENLQGRLKEISKQLEGTKDTLNQREIELANSKASLREATDLLSTSRQYIIETQKELEETKTLLIEKSVALKYTERYAELLCKSARNYDFEMGVATNELVNKVERDVKRIEKLLQRKTKLKKLEHQERTTQNNLWDDQPKGLNEPDSKQIKLKYLEDKEKKIVDLESAIVDLKQELEQSNSLMKEKDNELWQMRSELQRKDMEAKDLESSIGDLKQDLELRNTSLHKRCIELEQINSDFHRKGMEIQDLESSIFDLKRDLELRETSLKEKENELHLMRSDLQRKDMELKKAEERCSMLEGDSFSLKNELTALKAHLGRQDSKIKEMEKLTYTKDSDLREGRRELEKLGHQLDEKEQKIELLKRSLAEKEHEIDSMTENLKNKLFEIMRLEKRLDDAKIEISKSFEVYQMRIRYLEAVVPRLRNGLEGQGVLLRVNDKELRKANLDIQVKKGEVDGFKTRIRRREERFELNKQISTEREFKLVQETKALEENATCFETHRGQKKKGKKRTGSNITGSQYQKENKPEDLGREQNVVMAKLTGEQIEVAMTVRIQQMVADMNVMQEELEGTRKENAKLVEDNKALEDHIIKLEKEAVEQKQLSSERLNNALDHVRMKRAEIRRLKVSQNIAPDVSLKLRYDPEADHITTGLNNTSVSLDGS